MYFSLLIVSNNGAMIYARHFADDKVDQTQNFFLQVASSLFTINDLTKLAMDVN